MSPIPSLGRSAWDRPQLPILPASATNDVIAKALEDRGIPKCIYDFIEHNLGKAAALVAILSAEPRP